MSAAVKEFLAFCNDPKDPFNMQIAELHAEQKRDHWIAAGAALEIANGVSPFHPDISTEALQALHEWTGQAIQDREVVAAENQPSLPFWDKQP